MADSQTQTQTAPASSDEAPSASPVSNAGSDPSQTSNTAPVVGGNDEGKSAASDEASGAADGGDRQRPGRAERRISELSSTIKKLESELAEKNKLADSLNGAPVNPSSIKFPDYSQMSEITPDQLKQDIIKTAEQIVDLKMTAAGTALEQKLTQGQAVEKSAAAIESAIKKYPALNPQSDDYDREMDLEITEAYAEVLKRDPSYSFSKFIKPFERILDVSDTTEKSASKTEPSSGRRANRPNTPVRRSNEFPAGGTTEEMEKWFANNRG